MREAESRYSRQSRFAPLGDQGQRKIRSSGVLIIGCGALGTVQAEILTRAGIGRLRIADRDFVEYSNLQRQFLFEESDAADALPKAVAAARRLARINSEVEIDSLVKDVTPANIEEMFEEIDLVLDGTDNFETRYLINDAAVSLGKPWIYGAAVGSYGIKMPVIPGNSACFRCVYPDPPQGTQPTCDTAGVLASATASVASLQAGDAIRLLTSAMASTTITTLDVWEGSIRQIPVPPRDPECPCCAKRNFAYLNGSRKAPISLCGRNAVQIHERSRPVDLAELAGRLSVLAVVRSNEFALKAELEPYELTVFPDGRAIIKGTTDPGVARSLYARYIGN